MHMKRAIFFTRRGLAKSNENASIRHLLGRRADSVKKEESSFSHPFLSSKLAVSYHSISNNRSVEKREQIGLVTLAKARGCQQPSTTELERTQAFAQTRP